MPAANPWRSPPMSSPRPELERKAGSAATTGGSPPIRCGRVCRDSAYRMPTCFRAHSSVGQSSCLTSSRSLVRVRLRPLGSTRYPALRALLSDWLGCLACGIRADQVSRAFTRDAMVLPSARPATCSFTARTMPPICFMPGWLPRSAAALAIWAETSSASSSGVSGWGR